MLAAPVAAPALRVRGVLANAVTVLETKPVFDVILPLAVIYPIVSTPPELIITALAYPQKPTYADKKAAKEFFESLPFQLYLLT